MEWVAPMELEKETIEWLQICDSYGVNSPMSSSRTPRSTSIYSPRQRSSAYSPKRGVEQEGSRFIFSKRKESAMMKRSDFARDEVPSSYDT